MSDQAPPPTGPQLRPLPGAKNPLTEPSPYRELIADLKEQVVAGLEKALADQETARERMAAAANGASGESLNGDVTVRVDAKGLIQSAQFGPEVATLTPEELRSETLAAFEEARTRLGLAAPSPETVDRLGERPVAAALMQLLEREGLR